MRSRADAAWVLDELVQRAGEAAPRKYGATEPLRKVFNSIDISEAIDIWSREPAFLWKAKGRGALGQYWPASRSHPVDLLTIVLPGKVDLTALVALLERIGGRYPPLFGYVNTVYESELKDLENYGRRLQPLAQGLTLHALRDGAVSIPAAFFVGSELLDTRKSAQLVSLPVADARAVQNGVIVRLLDSCWSEDAAERLAASREAVASALGATNQQVRVLWKADAVL